MAKIEVDIEHLADLARIELSEEERKNIEPQIEGILAYVSKLSLVDTKDVPEAVYITDAVNVFREDIVEPCDSTVHERAVAAFPEATGTALKVQGVFEDQTEEL